MGDLNPYASQKHLCAEMKTQSQCVTHLLLVQWGPCQQWWLLDHNISPVKARIFISYHFSYFTVHIISQKNNAFYYKQLPFYTLHWYTHIFGNLRNTIQTLGSTPFWPRFSCTNIVNVMWSVLRIALLFQGWSQTTSCLNLPKVVPPLYRGRKLQTAHSNSNEFRLYRNDNSWWITWKNHKVMNANFSACYRTWSTKIKLGA